jgi:hypothetical protein
MSCGNEVLLPLTFIPVAAYGSFTVYKCLLLQAPDQEKSKLGLGSLSLFG